MRTPGLIRTCSIVATRERQQQLQCEVKICLRDSQGRALRQAKSIFKASQERYKAGVPRQASAAVKVRGGQKVVGIAHALLRPTCPSTSPCSVLQQRWCAPSDSAQTRSASHTETPSAWRSAAQDGTRGRPPFAMQHLGCGAHAPAAGGSTGAATPSAASPAALVGHRLPPSPPSASATPSTPSVSQDQLMLLPPLEHCARPAPGRAWVHAERPFWLHRLWQLPFLAMAEWSSLESARYARSESDAGCKGCSYLWRY